MVMQSCVQDRNFLRRFDSDQAGEYNGKIFDNGQKNAQLGCNNIFLNPRWNFSADVTNQYQVGLSLIISCFFSDSSASFLNWAEVG